MALSIGLRWMFDGSEIDPRLLDLLRAIAERGSLQSATRDVGLSYRHSWELIGRLEQTLGQAVVELERGRGARLTAFGRSLTEGAREIEERLAPQLKRCAAELNRPQAGIRADVETQLTLCASHDFALARFVELLAKHGGPRVELRFQGSVAALAVLARNQCDIAGFHVPKLHSRWVLLEPYRPWLKSRSLRVIHFADRQQGLMVARNNPLKIATLADLVRRRARFVNRQPDSGTRICFDALLSAERIRPAQIEGYRTEEFTHAAVAAMVASGAADAGFGIEAAAVQQGLAFVPLASERYFLALRRTALSGKATETLLAALSSRWFRNMARELPGYALPAKAPQAMPVQEAFHTQERDEKDRVSAAP